MRAGQVYRGRRVGAPARRIQVARVVGRDRSVGARALVFEVTRSGRRKDPRRAGTFPIYLTWDMPSGSWSMPSWYTLERDR